MNYVPAEGYRAVLHHGEVRGYADLIRGVRESQWRELDGRTVRIKVSETANEIRVFAIVKEREEV
ncbi:hypothetical protein EEL32_10340 [Brevibacillus laterosporus]|nr:hypothetical protein [Brevibacillus laterosporus]TPG73321.1 hypothetical protein EEL31_02840 [Brevibacillus laterosporus]TPG88151.1 hypothetical protein EEL32_10340 [Brevibacillus laterosporus]